MICRSFITDPVPYRTQDQIPVTFFPDAYYFPDQIPAPYGERIKFVMGLWQTDQEDRIHLAVGFDQHNWPGYDLAFLTFSSVTGLFIERSPSLGAPGGFALGLHFRSIIQDAAGQLWARFGGLPGRVQQVDPASFALMDGTTVLASHFGLLTFSIFLFDRARDVALIGGDIYGRARREVAVYSFSSGALLYAVPLPQDPAAITYAEGSTVYLLLRDNSILGFDYAERRVFQYTLVPLALPDGEVLGNAPLSFDLLLSWSRKYRRFLLCAYTPDNPDGSSTTRVLGYRNRPIAAHVCRPVPLARARAGQRTPVLVKQIGDLGEGIAGQAELAASEGAAASVVRALVTLDGDGEGRGEVLGLEEGGAELVASIRVACTLDDPVIDNPLGVVG